MIFEIRAFGPLGTNSFLIAADEGRKAYIFDAPQGSCKYWKKRLEELSLTAGGLLLTHSHWDHIADAAEIKKQLDVPVWIEADDRDNLEHPGSDGLPQYLHIPAVMPDFLLSDGEIVKLDGFSLLVIHTPGHTPGCVCFYWADQQLLIAGDTLFRGGIGRLDLPTARPELMRESLLKLMKLPRETRVFPGHGDSTTIAREAETLNHLCEEER